MFGKDKKKEKREYADNRCKKCPHCPEEEKDKVEWWQEAGDPDSEYWWVHPSDDSWDTDNE